MQDEWTLSDRLSDGRVYFPTNTWCLGTNELSRIMKEIQDSTISGYSSSQLTSILELTIHTTVNKDDIQTTSVSQHKQYCQSTYLVPRHSPFSSSKRCHWECSCSTLSAFNSEPSHSIRMAAPLRCPRHQEGEGQKKDLQTECGVSCWALLDVFFRRRVSALLRTGEMMSA